ncbi:unnamed protein product [Adineta steineri]|uniref:Oxidoreductase n=1 Tax=Adineta steineri TaxID=433720 RepID=A0A819BQ33_9BILA|nr:unnamed protein product [Adineta steineri]CAF3798120.1 unnamed protein product [Adineta steineri]
MSSCFTFDQIKTLIPTLNQLPPLPAHPLSIYSIGAGSIVNSSHLPSYQLFKFQVHGIYDRNQDAAKKTAEKFNIPKVFNSLDELIATAEKESSKVIYDIAIPATEISKILQQLPNNSFALVQKPMGETFEQAKEIKLLCKEKNIHIGINFQLRYAPQMLAVKDLLKREVLGKKLTTVEIHVNTHTPFENWKFLEKVTHMELTYHSIHYIDLIRDLLSPWEPTSVQCHSCKHINQPKLDSVRTHLSLSYENNDPQLYVTIHTNHFHTWGIKYADSYLKIEGTQGVLRAQMGLQLEYGDQRDPDRLELSTNEMNGEWIDIPLKGNRFPNSFIGPMSSIIRMAQGETDKILTSEDDAIKTMAIVEAAYQSTLNQTKIVYDNTKDNS